MKIGRNDPCPCGSGKKYKHCCFEKNLSQSSSEIERIDNDDNLIPPFDAHFYKDGDFAENEILSELEQAMQKLWDEFRDASFDKKLVLLKKAIQTPGFDAFSDIAEMFEDLADKVNSEEEVRKFLKCVDFGQKKNIQTDEGEAGYIFAQAVRLCIKFDQAKLLEKYFIALAGYADIVIDSFTEICDNLAYYGHTSVLKNGYKTGWSRVRDSDGIMGWAINDFMTAYLDATLFDFIEKQKSPRFSDPKLQKELAAFDDLNMEALEDYFTVFVQPPNQQWNAGDFFIAEKAVIGQSFQKNIWNLCNQFIIYLHNTHNINYSRATMMRMVMNRYLLERAGGEFSKKIHWKSFKQNVNHDKEPMLYNGQVLCPDPKTTDSYLAGLLNFLNPRAYQFAAMVETIPFWLRFLVEVGLIDKAIRLKKLKKFEDFEETIFKIVRDKIDDKFVIDNINRAWRR